MVGTFIKTELFFLFIWLVLLYAVEPVSGHSSQVEVFLGGEAIKVFRFRGGGESGAPNHDIWTGSVFFLKIYWYICKTEWESERKWDLLSSALLPQMATKSGGRLGWSHEPGASSKSSMWVVGAQTPCPFLIVFSLAGSWVRSTAAGTYTSTPMGCQLCRLPHTDLLGWILTKERDLYLWY